MTPNVETIANKYMQFDSTELEYLAYKLNIVLGHRPPVGTENIRLTTDFPVPVHDAGGNTQMSYRLCLSTFSLIRVDEDNIKLEAIEDNNYFYTGNITLPIINLNPTWLVGGSIPGAGRPYTDNMKYKESTFTNYLSRGNGALYMRIYFH